MVVMAKDDSIQIERLEMPPFGTNAYIVTCQVTQDSALVDAPAQPDILMDNLKGTNPKYILLTHNHMDHIGALAELHATLKIPLVVHAADATNLPLTPDMLVDDGDTISLGESKLEVLHTPGHTAGSLCFKVGNYMISGDTIFPGGPGKTRSPEAFQQIIQSITGKILTLPDDMTLYPGHGDPTSVASAREEFAVFSSRSHDPNLCGDVLWLSS
ncbi:MAG: MBL fold metallo-hydrolase [Dehalococcoidales bacterium]|nr:MAG: MBL fold metallo-hydrolase [Dehalococcoidales bacterium]